MVVKEGRIILKTLWNFRPSSASNEGVGGLAACDYKESVMGKNMLSGKEQEKISELRHELDDWGNPKWSYREIAELLGLSESTVWRAANKSGGYKVKNLARQRRVEEEGWAALVEDKAKVLEKPPTEELQRAAKASEERFLAGLVQPEFLRPLPGVVEKMERYGARKAPLSPMEGGEYPGDVGEEDRPPTGLLRLVKEADEAKRLAEGGV